NEGLPSFVVEAMKEKYDLPKLTIGVLGMAFKANNDDPRESLSYKLKKRLEIEAGTVLCHDPYINDPRFATLEEIRAKADVIVIAAPHKDYANETWDGKQVVDMWNFYSNGGLI